MLKRESMYLIADNLDESIKSQTSVYDVTLFSSFVDFERYVDMIPVVIDVLVLNTDVLPFTGTSIDRVMSVLNSSFVEIRGGVIYLVDNSYSVQQVNKFLVSKGLSDWSVYRGDLSSKFISDIVSGEGRNAAEGQVDVVTYRVRASEYAKQQQQSGGKDEDDYHTDEDLLSGIPDEEEPEDIAPSIDKLASTVVLTGTEGYERTTMAFLVAQYMALSQKTIIIEHDIEYHMLTELVTKSGVNCEFIKVEELRQDLHKMLGKIRNSGKRLIVIGCISRIKYDYNILFSILLANLKNDVGYFIRECTYEESPYGGTYTIVIRNTIPDVLACCNSLKCDIDASNTKFVGVQLGSLGPVNITSEEMGCIISQLLEKEKVSAQVVQLHGVVLNKGDVVYDIFSNVARNN